MPDPAAGPGRDGGTATGGWSPLDVHFGALMQRLDGREAPGIALAARLVSRATAAGHVCIDLAAAARAGADAVEAPPALADWLAVLRASPVVGAPGDFRPLILDAAHRLYLNRYWEYEHEVADALRSRAAPVDGIDDARLRSGLEALFPAAADGPDRQRLAAAVALLRRFAVVSGGPGTGKTTTVLRILALLVAQSPAGLRIALAAPTGKAAARLQESVRAGKDRLAQSGAFAADALAAIPGQASTLHRLLGVLPDRVYFRHDRHRPLPVDVLVIDEASMVDLALMAKTLRALPPQARLILLGDRDQLASVEAGAVLGDICAGGGAPSPAFAARLAALGCDVAPAATSGQALADCIVLLERSYRFGAGGGIGRLAAGIRAGDADGVAKLLAAGDPEVAAAPLPQAAALATVAGERIAAGYAAYLDRVGAGDPAGALAAFGAFRVLCAHRTGSAGVTAVNAAIEALLEARGGLDVRGEWYPGRPVLVSANDHSLRLFNGDTGVVLPDPAADGALRVWFEADAGGVRAFAPGRLPACETAWALTVHKAQGSEFDDVLLLLPDAPSPIVTRELLYTAVTRARRRVEVRGPAAVLAAGIGTRIERASGLREQLWDAPGPAAPG